LSAAGVVMRSGGVTLGMRLRGYGYGARLVRVGAVAPSAVANRVIYQDGRLTQWYVNGPLGLEQGYTLTTPPTRRAALARNVWLTFALGVSGGARVAVAPGGVVFSHEGVSLAYRGLVAMDARGRRLPARVTVAAREVLLWVDDAGAQYPVRVDPLFQQQAKLTASDGAALDGLGASVAVSGRTVVVGAPGAAVGPNSGQGAVYVFTEPGTGWAGETQAAKLTASGGASHDGLGASVAVSGGTVVAGAPGAAVGPNSGQGAVYVFTEPGTGWADETQAAKLTASGGAASDDLGRSVAVSGGTVVAGAPGAAVGSNTFQGVVYVFTQPGTGWADETQAAKLTASDGAANDNLGQSVAASGGTVVAGAPGSNAGHGAVYVFGSSATGTSPGSHYLARFHSPRPGSRWKAGLVVPVTVAVDYAGGSAIPGSLASALAAGCELTIRARGAQRLPTHCMRYDSAAREFVYHWKLSTARTGQSPFKCSCLSGALAA
jgi:hypothetical protein